jgi:hypothetical protein
MMIKLKRHNKLFKNRDEFNREQLERLNKNNTKYKKRNREENEKNVEQQEKSSYRIKTRKILRASYSAFVFFCCHLPIRIFIFWSYIANYLSPIVLNEANAINNFRVRLTDLISNIATLIYFLHTISNPIIYNFSSIKFRIAAYKLLFLIDKKLKYCFCINTDEI